MLGRLDLSLLNAVGGMVVVLDGGSRVLAASAGWREAMGYSAGQVVGRHFRDFFAERGEAEAGCAEVDRLRGKGTAGVSPEWEGAWVTRAAGRRRVTWSARVLEGRGECVVVTASEVGGGRRRAEDPVEVVDAIGEGGQWFRQLAESLDGVFWMMDPETERLLYVSPAYERLWGRTVASLHERPESFVDGIHPDDRERVRAVVRPVVDWGFELEYRVVRPNGTEIWVRDRAFAIRDEAGKLQRLCGIAEDVTSQRRVAEALRMLNERLEHRVTERTAAVREQSRILRSVLEHMGDGVVVVAGADGRIIMANRAATRVAGAEGAWTGAGAGGDAADFYRADGETAYRAGDLPLVRALRGEAVDREEVFAAEAGVWLSVTARPLREEAGRLAGAVLVAHDVTERKRAERSLRESEQHYRELAERNLRLVREVEHRVRNNLAGLLALVSVMGHRAADVREFAGAVEGRLRGMVHVHQLLANGGWGSVELRLVIESTLESMRRIAPCEARVVVEGEAVRVRAAHVGPLASILVEWFTNSCKYGAHSVAGGGIEVRWEVSGEGRVRLTWRERGGPPVCGEVKGSLGSELVKGFAANELRGRCAMRYPEEGAEHELEFEVEDASVVSGPLSVAAAPGGASGD